MTSRDDIIIINKEKKNNFILWVFFGIIGFILIYFPFFGSNLKYTTGSFFSGVFKLIGTVCYTFGILLLVWGFLTLICFRSLSAIKIMLIGFILILIGNFWLDPGTFGIITQGKEVPKGYH